MFPEEKECLINFMNMPINWPPAWSTLAAEPRSRWAVSAPEVELIQRHDWAIYETECADPWPLAWSDHKPKPEPWWIVPPDFYANECDAFLAKWIKEMFGE